MDITLLFKAAVIARRNQLKNSGVDIQSHDILKSRLRCAYTSKFKDLVHQISQLRDFLMENRKDYMNISPANFSMSTNMTDFDRDKVDSEAQYIIKTCSQLVSTYKKEAYLLDEVNQEVENRKAILDLIENYLKAVCKIYTEQKAIRVKLTVELQKMSKLANDDDKVIHNIKEKDTLEDSITRTNDTLEDKERLVSSGRLRYSTFAAANETEENALSEEEMQMFEMENEQLYNELNSLNDEVCIIFQYLLLY